MLRWVYTGLHAQVWVVRLTRHLVRINRCGFLLLIRCPMFQQDAADVRSVVFINKWRPKMQVLLIATKIYFEITSLSTENYATYTIHAITKPAASAPMLSATIGATWHGAVLPSRTQSCALEASVQTACVMCMSELRLARLQENAQGAKYCSFSNYRRIHCLRGSVSFLCFVNTQVSINTRHTFQLNGIRDR